MGRTQRIVSIFFGVFIFQILRVDAALNYVASVCSTDNGNYTENSVYQKNLNLLSLNFSSQASVANFKKLTVGKNLDEVYGLFQCRQDLSLDVCSACIQDATHKIFKACPLSREAITWYMECMLRYANRPIFSVNEKDPSYNRYFNVSYPFRDVLQNTMDSLIAEAANGTDFGHFATKEVNTSFSDKLYCLVQCTSDLSASDCNNCLRAGLAGLNTRCHPSAGCTWAMSFSPSCHLRYDLILFYNDTHLFSLSPPPLNTPRGKKLKTPAIVGIAVATSVGLLLLILGGIWMYQRKVEEGSRGMSTEAPGLHDMKIDGSNSLGEVEFVQYDFSTLKDATGGFSDDNKLGQGGFGIVYKGTLNSGEEIAIKRLSGNSGQGAKELMTEAQIVAKLQHRNLVKLVGFCSECDEKLLVYEFMPNKSLDCFLFDPTKRALLGWDTRYKIIVGVARGLQYLHEDSRLTVVHRDLKPNNILLDREMNPKIADFGIAKHFGGEQRGGNTSRIVGTYGYMAPEYMLTGEYSNKTDVYSFGVIVLEIVSGRKNRVFNQAPEKEDLPRYAWNLWKVRRSLELMDPGLDNNCSSSEVMRCIQIAMLCVQGNSANRPTMAAIVLMLTGSITLPSPLSPTMPSLHFNMSMSDADTEAAESSHRETDQPITKSSCKLTDTGNDLYPR